MRELSEGEKARLNAFLSAKNLKLRGIIARGHSSFVFLVSHRGKMFALKLEREDSGRKEMLKKEVTNLKKANRFDIGPKLYDYNSKLNVVLMEFVPGKPFREWLSTNIKRAELLEFLEELFYQAAILDKIGLDHGQLCGRGINILVRENKPVIIDFEKASQRRKPHNFSKLFAWLFMNESSGLARRVREILLKK